MHWVDNTTGESFHSAHLQHPPGSVVFADVNPGLVSAVVGSSGGVLSVVKWREQAPVLGAEAIAELVYNAVGSQVEGAGARHRRGGYCGGGAQEGVAEQDAEAPRAGGGGGGGGEGGAARAGKRV
eukprot:4764411-Pyramimonas_sp.AAC.1